MKDNIMSIVEVDRVARNIDMLEMRLGYPAPRNLLNYDALKSDILSITEVDILARNIEMINMRTNNYHKTGLTLNDIVPFISILVMIIFIILGI